MEEDNRMLFVRNMEYLGEQNIDYSDIEREVKTDAHIVGDFEYGPYTFAIWEFGYKNPGEERKLIIKYREAKLDRLATRSGFYHGGGIADELVILSSLILRRRFILGSIVRIDNCPIMFNHRDGMWIDKQLIDGESNLQELTGWFDRINKLEEAMHQKLILAAKFYHKAIEIIEDQPDIAYLHLVSAIEILCQDTDIGNIQIMDYDPHLSDLINKIEDKELKNAIEKTLIKRERFISRRFVRFILDHIDESFWSDGLRPQFGKVDPEELQLYLKRIYHQRSKTLHTGELFPPSVFRNPLQDSEVDPSIAIMAGDKKWEAKDYIPNPYFFERLVNHVLKNYICRLSETA